jgi:hypothetical protein
VSKEITVEIWVKQGLKIILLSVSIYTVVGCPELLSKLGGLLEDIAKKVSLVVHLKVKLG